LGLERSGHHRAHREKEGKIDAEITEEMKMVPARSMPLRVEPTTRTFKPMELPPHFKLRIGTPTTSLGCPECGQRVHGPKQMEFKMVFIFISKSIIISILLFVREQHRRCGMPPIS
jgi:hypothetical protein